MTQSYIQGLKRNFEMLTMTKIDSVVDFVMKFTYIVSELQFLRVTPSKFGALRLSLEKYDNLDKVSLDEVIGSLTVHELRVKEQ